MRYPRSERPLVGFAAAALLISGALATGSGPLTMAAASAEQVAARTVVSAPADPPIDVLRDDAERVREALAETEAKRTMAEGELATARAQVEAASQKVAAADAAERAARERVIQVDGAVRAAGVEAYVGHFAPSPLGILAHDDVEDAAWASTFLQFRADELVELLDRQQDAHDDLRRRRAAAASAAAQAEAAEDGATAKVNELIALEADQSELLTQVDERLDAALSEAAALAAVDAAAAEQLAAKEQALRDAAALSVAPAVLAASEPAPPLDTTTVPPATVPPPAGAPVANPPATTTPPRQSPPTTSRPVVIPPIIPVDTVNVRGFVVARSIADPLTQMLDAIAGAGLVVGGGAYRDVNMQISLRRSHCGPTDYDIWQRPSSQCSPPTAIPGRSMHEKGLAIDFTCSGALISDRANPCFVWLAANAAQYGLFNLPSEPWHWSTNGN